MESETVFHEPWWLDIVCSGMDVGFAEVSKRGATEARWPWAITTNRGLRRIVQPPLTQYLGPTWEPSLAKPAKATSRYHALMAEILDQLPAVDDLRVRCSPDVRNWLPMYWKGMQQTTRYTYIVNGLEDLERVRSGFAENISRDLKKAERSLRAREGTADELLMTTSAVFSRFGRGLPFQERMMRQLVEAAKGRDAGAVVAVEDRGGQVHAVLFTVWGMGRAHYVMGGAHPQLKNSGANTLAIWSAMKRTSLVAKSFDLEGSMIPAVERYLKGFGGDLTPYFDLTARTLKARAARTLSSGRRVVRDILKRSG